MGKYRKKPVTVDAWHSRCLSCGKPSEVNAEHRCPHCGYRGYYDDGSACEYSKPDIFEQTYEEVEDLYINEDGNITPALLKKIDKVGGTLRADL